MSFTKGLGGLVGGLLAFLISVFIWGAYPVGVVGALFYTIAIVALAVTIVAPVYFWGGSVVSRVRKNA